MNGSSKSGPVTIPEPLEIALRAYVPPKAGPNGFQAKDIGPSKYSLIFDCETTIDERQALRFGAYQVRKGPELWETGIFVNPDTLTKSDIREIRKFAIAGNFRFMAVAEFTENVFFGIGYELRATIIGFNLPFDISRLAINHGNSRGRTMKGGFSFKLSPHKYRPNIQVKHLSPRASFIRFTTRAVPGRGMRRRRMKIPPRPGYFVDVKTLAAALTSQSFNLASLADFLKTESRKLKTEEHGLKITASYLKYATQDVQTTWECYVKLLQKFEEHQCTGAQPSQVFSEASVGKLYLREMNIRPWRECQPDFPPELIGIILSSYFGGRSEVHHRRILSEITYCDFRSMYPTCCTLMQLWDFVIASEMKWRDATKETRKFLKQIELSDLQNPAIWSELSALVQIRPDEDIFPIRANYGDSEQATIGVNYLSDERAYWFTLADCVASKLLTGKATRILKAIRFEPGDPQTGLRTIKIAGNPEYSIEPTSQDFYCRLIDLRGSVKGKIKSATDGDKARLDSEQLALKIIANAASYGCFVELNVEELAKPDKRLCYGYRGEPFEIATSKIEAPGRYFHPLLATLITGGARLMLAITERLVADNGLDWAFCDTDSMAIARPDCISAQAFNSKVEAVRHWFEPLNPYEEKGSSLKLEDVNLSVDGKGLEPLYALAISAKRYALFNLSGNGEIIIRKASAHGLGHLLAPYGEGDAPTSILKPRGKLSEIGVERWQYDLWHQIIRATLYGHPDQVDLRYHPALKQPAASRYGATTPDLLSWFRVFNQNREYAGQVRPHNFLLSFQLSLTALNNSPEIIEALKGDRLSEITVGDLPRPIAPYDRDPSKAAKHCFDRNTGEPVPVAILQRYEEVLASYHLRPEYKFSNGEQTDCGITQRRHVMPKTVRNIGKESNRWVEQFYLGGEEDAAVEYGAIPEDEEASFEQLRQQIISIGQREFSRKTGISRRTIAKFISRSKLRNTTVKQILSRHAHGKPRP
jgi:hypothetical protein